jgi:polyisoprenoid-binding protein YceI
MLTRRFGRWVALTALAGGALAAERPLVFDETQSRIEVAVHATADSFTAKLNHFEPAVALADDGRVTAARVAFHFRDLVTGKEKRDAAMHTWQQTDQFPDGLFVLSSLEPAASPGAGFVAQGRLTLHGVARDVTFPVSVLREGGRYTIDGEARVDTRDFGLPIIRMMLVLKVDPVVKVRFHLTGQPQS